MWSSRAWGSDMARKRPEDAKPDAWMPFYIGPYLADTGHLSTEQHGAYLLLLLACWKGRGYLPDDAAQLQAITRLQDGAWARSWPVLRVFFIQAADGQLTQKRLLAEYLDAVERYGKRVASSQAAAAAKAARAAEAERNTIREPNGVPNGSPNGKPNGQHNNKDKDSSSSKKEKPLVPPSASRFAEFWDAYPKASRKGKQAAAKKWAARGLDAIADQILDDVRARASKDRQWLEGYVPHASTYVNGAGWEDAIDDSAPKGALDKNGRPEIVPNPEGTSPKIEETPKRRLEGAISYAQGMIDAGQWTKADARQYVKPYQDAVNEPAP